MKQNCAVLDEKNSIERTGIEMLSIIWALAFYSSELVEVKVNKQLRTLLAVNTK